MVSYIVFSQLLYFLSWFWQIALLTACLNVVVYTVYLIILMARGEMVHAPDRFSGVCWFESSRASP